MPFPETTFSSKTIKFDPKIVFGRRTICQRVAMDSSELDKLATWLMHGARSASTPADFLKQMCERLVAAGIPLWRVGAFVQTLHPDVFGRSFTFSGRLLRHYVWLQILAGSLLSAIFIAGVTGLIRND